MRPAWHVRLCQREGQELQLSHFLPAGVYRAAQDESQENPHPILISDDDEPRIRRR